MLLDALGHINHLVQVSRTPILEVGVGVKLFGNLSLAWIKIAVNPVK